MQEPRSRASEKVGRVVAELRLAATMSRKRLAERAALDERNLARIESGQGNPTLFVLIQLATALDIPVARLVEGLEASDLPNEIKPYSEAEYRRALRAQGAVVTR